MTILKHCLHRKYLFVLSLLVLPFLLTACSVQELPVIGKYFGKGAVVGGPTTLTVWGMWESPEVMKAVVAKYEATHPNVKINYEDRSQMKPTDYKDTVFSRAAKDTGADVVLVHNTWVPKLKGSLTPMPAKLMDAQTYAQTYYPASASSAVADGKIYAIPQYYDGLALVYNKAHFDAIGQKSAPTAWDEFRGLATKLSQRSEGKLMRAGAAIGNANNVDFFSDILGLLFTQAGADMPKDLDSQYTKDALTYYTNFVKVDGVWDDTFPEASEAFAKEKVSMIFIPAWNLLDIIKSRPDLQIGVAPVPQASPKDPTTWGSFWMFAVPAGSKNQAAAWDFAHYMGQEEAQLTMYSEASKYRSYGAPYSMVSLSGQLSSQQYLKTYLDTAPYSKSSELASRAGNVVQVTALKEAVNAVLSGQDVTTALTAAKGKMLQAK